jgi:uncharacterized protein YdhG (YjbR/CyaY superfamily)
MTSTAARSSDYRRGMSAADVDAHLEKIGQPHRSTLMALRATLLSILPRAEEGLKYGMPCVLLQGKVVAGYDAFKRHCSYFPHSGNVLEHVPGIPDGYVTTPGTLQFPVDKPLSVALVKRLVKVRIAQISDVRDGKRFEFYPDGAVKAVGGMKAGKLHGKWKWYRQDGTLMRTGQFVSGAKTGVWATWDRDGHRVSGA